MTPSDSNYDITVQHTMLGLSNWILDNSEGGIIPSYMLKPVAYYLLFGRRPKRGGFLEAILLDLPFSQVISLSDDDNRNALMAWHRLLYNVFPRPAWHSPEAVSAWCEQKGTQGQRLPYLEGYVEKRAAADG